MHCCYRFWLVIRVTHYLCINVWFVWYIGWYYFYSKSAMGSKVESQTKKDVPYLKAIISWLLGSKSTFSFNSIQIMKIYVKMNNNNLLFCFTRLSDLIVHRILRPRFQANWMLQISAPGRKAAQCTGNIIQFTNKLIADLGKLIWENWNT